MRAYFVERALEEDEREAKLPVWARDKIHSLRKAAVEARDDLKAYSAGTEPGPFWIEDEDGQRFYLNLRMGWLKYGPAGGNAELGFYPNDRQSPEGWLTVIGDRSITAAPWSGSNVLLLHGKDRG